MRQTTFLSLCACMAFLDSLTKEAFLAASQPFAHQVWEFSELQILLLVLGHGLMGITSIVFVTMQPLVHFQGAVSTVMGGLCHHNSCILLLGFNGSFSKHVERDGGDFGFLFFFCFFWLSVRPHGQ